VRAPDCRNSGGGGESLVFSSTWVGFSMLLSGIVIAVVVAVGRIPESELMMNLRVDDV
jgi:hypothetical protein